MLISELFPIGLFLTILSLEKLKPISTYVYNIILTTFF
jgi:hypothetical protein